MKALVTIEIEDHQSEVSIPPTWLSALHRAGEMAWCEVVKVARLERECYDGEWIDVALVSALDSDRAHQQFMGIAGATDVITFWHGELVICPQVACTQASEYGEPLLRELLRYLIHGMLHLAGYTDEEATERREMEVQQEKIVQFVWQREMIELASK